MLGAQRGVIAAIFILSCGAAAAQQAEAEAVELSPILVEAESDATLVQEGYVAIQGRQATKVDTPIQLLPQAVSTVTQDQIEDQAPRTLNETISYSAGARSSDFGFDSRYDAFTLRGFSSFQAGMFRDGLRQYNGPSAWFRNDPYTLEAVSLLKGPSSSLYGVSGPGGIVSMVSKRPKDTPFHEVGLTFGEHNRYQATADFSGPVPIGEEGALSYRLTGLARRADTHLPGYPDDKYLIAPALTLRPGPDTEITFLGEYDYAKTGANATFVNIAPDTVTNIFSGDPNFNDFKQNQGRIGYQASHRVADWLILRQNMRYAAVDSDLRFSNKFFTAPGVLGQRWGRYHEKMASFTLDTLAQFNFETGPIAHEAIIGVDYAIGNYRAGRNNSAISAADAEAKPLTRTAQQDIDQLGLYLHDQLSYDALTLFLSGRYDLAKSDTSNLNTTTFRYERFDQTDIGWSWRVGASYAFDNGLTPYFNIATSFLPNVGVVFDDIASNQSRAANPTTGIQKEIGLKYAPPGTNALITASLFDIEQADGVILQAVPGGNKQQQFDLRSVGAEIEASLSLENGFSLIGAATWHRVTIENAVSGVSKGNRLNAAPLISASLWGQYDASRGALKGLGVGAGLRFVGESYGDNANKIRNDARILVDMALSYDIPQAPGVQLQLNVRNLFDNKATGCAASFCYREEGRLITGGLRYRF